MKKLLLCATTMICFLALAHTASARSAYDGSWDLVFVTQRGACDPTYNFTVNISNGVVTHPNLVQFRGYVAKSGAVRASVTVQDKYASGSGKLSSGAGRGTWRGRAGMHNAPATGPRNEIEIATRRERKYLDARLPSVPDKSRRNREG